MAKEKQTIKVEVNIPWYFIWCTGYFFTIGYGGAINIEGLLAWQIIAVKALELLVWPFLLGERLAS